MPPLDLSLPQAAPVTLDAWLTLAVLLALLALFVWNRWRADVVAALSAAALIVLGVVTPAQGISGFANEATVTVAFMLIISGGLVKTGAIDAVALLMTRLARKSEARLLALILAVVTPVSALINNTAAVAVLLPVVLGVARNTGNAPSKLLMPLSFASQLGGTLTLIGTSTNLLVAAIVVDLGFERIGLFDITAPAAVLAGIGLLYLLTLGRRLTPNRPAPRSLLEIYELNEYVTALEVQSRSPLAGRSLAESRFGSRFGLQIIIIEREEGRVTMPSGGVVLRTGDVLLVQGTIADIAEVGQREGLKITGTSSSLEKVGKTEQRLAEILITPRSRMIGRTLRQLEFRARYGVSALGIRRHGEPIHAAIGDIRLRPGDILLVQGSTEALRQLHEDGHVSLIGLIDMKPRRRRLMLLATSIMTLVVLLPALGLTTILMSAFIGVLLMILTGCIAPDEAYAELDGQVLVLLAALLPLGIALQETGVAAVIARGLAGVAEPLGAYGLLACVYVVTVALTAIVSNAATAVVMTPIAVSVAIASGLSPMPFVLAVMFAASNSFVTPMGYHTNLFVYGPGGYEFHDYIRVGGPLTILMIIAATLVIPLFHGF